MLYLMTKTSINLSIYHKYIPIYTCIGTCTMYIHPSINLISIYLVYYLSIHPPIYYLSMLFIHVFIYPSIYYLSTLFIHLFIHPSIYYLHVSIYLSLYLIHPSIHYLFINRYIPVCVSLLFLMTPYQSILQHL